MELSDQFFDSDKALLRDALNYATLEIVSLGENKTSKVGDFFQTA